jgi:protein TonB
VFESYLKPQGGRSRARRLAIAVFSVGLHAGAIALIVFLSLYHVDELPAPQVMITFFTAPPPPPPPPPPPAPKAPVRQPKKPKPEVIREDKPKPDEIQPPKTPPKKKKEEPKDSPKSPDWAADGRETGQAGGTKGGVAGGVAGGLPQAKPQPIKPTAKKPVFVKQQVVEQLKITGPMPEYLPAAKMAKVQGVVIVKLCLKEDGTVDRSRTTILKSLSALDEEVLSKVRSWRYRPYKVNGEATPVCFPVRFVFRFK